MKSNTHLEVAFRIEKKRGSLGSIKCTQALKYTSNNQKIERERKKLVKKLDRNRIYLNLLKNYVHLDQPWFRLA